MNIKIQSDLINSNERSKPSLKEDSLHSHIRSNDITLNNKHAFGSQQMNAEEQSKSFPSFVGFKSGED